MAKITMKNLSWIGIPDSWDKDYRTLSLRVDGNTPFPLCPSLVTTAEKELEAAGKLSVAPQGGECGILVFQTPKSQFAVGVGKEGYTIHYRNGGYGNDTFIPQKTDRETVILMLRKQANGFSVWDGDTMISKATLPASETSFSYGFYFANNNEEPFIANLTDFHVVFPSLATAQA